MKKDKNLKVNLPPSPEFKNNLIIKIELVNLLNSLDILEFEYAKIYSDESLNQMNFNNMQNTIEIKKIIESQLKLMSL